MTDTTSISAVEPGIPKRLGHIWIGPLNPPTAWMDTWREHHPDWEYTLYGNDVLTGRRWTNHELILHYFKSRKYAGVSDIMRYEILHEHGGFLPEADSICLQPMTSLFDKPCAYSVYENEVRGPGRVSPLLACEQGNPFAKALTVSLSALAPDQLGKPWYSTGNLFMRRMIARRKPDIVLFPSHYMIPKHHSGVTYDGDGPIYAEQMWGTTKDTYKTFNGDMRPRVLRRRRQEIIEALESWF